MKKKYALVFIIILVLFSCVTNNDETGQTKNIDFSVNDFNINSLSGELSYSYLKAIDEFGSRVAGTKEEKTIADYIFAELMNMGYSPKYQFFNNKVKSQNIICTIKGQSNSKVVIGAHYDSVNNGNGTDDNASGISALLELAHNIKDINLNPTIEIVFFGSEEIGKIGSNYYVDNLDIQLMNITTMINIDSIIAGDKLYIHGNSETRDWLLDISDEKGYPFYIQAGLNEAYPPGTTGDWGDHDSFQKKGKEIIVFEATDWDRGDKDGYIQTDPQYGVDGKIWHTEYDNLKYIEDTFPGRVQDNLYYIQEILLLYLTHYN